MALEEARDLERILGHPTATRSSMVSRLLSSSHALNGDGDGPVWRNSVCTSASINALLPEHDATQRPALSVDMLGCRIGDEVRTEFQRMLVERRCKDIVDDELGTVGVRDLRHGLDVDELDRGIGRRLDEHDLRVGSHGLREIVRIAPVDECRGTPKRGISSSTT